MILGDGLRRGEILGLKWEDAESKYKLVLLTPKTESSKRNIPLNQFMVEELLRNRKEQEREKELYGEDYRDLGMVFCKPDGDYINPTLINLKTN